MFNPIRFGAAPPLNPSIQFGLHLKSSGADSIQFGNQSFDTIAQKAAEWWVNKVYGQLNDPPAILTGDAQVDTIASRLQKLDDIAKIFNLVKNIPTRSSDREAFREALVKLIKQKQEEVKMTSSPLPILLETQWSPTGLLLEAWTQSGASGDPQLLFPMQQKMKIYDDRIEVNGEALELSL
ncbi:MAG: hypothetical protein QE263_05415 [Vampirovibrionales bacterium]|nr:hypothetical protein [Vampirovibrionales bacterium]